MASHLSCLSLHRSPPSAQRKCRVKSRRMSPWAWVYDCFHEHVCNQMYVSEEGFCAVACVWKCLCKSPTNILSPGWSIKFDTTEQSRLFECCISPDFAWTGFCLINSYPDSSERRINEKVGWKRKQLFPCFHATAWWCLQCSSVLTTTSDRTWKVFVANNNIKHHTVLAMNWLWMFIRFYNDTKTTFLVLCLCDSHVWKKNT